MNAVDFQKKIRVGQQTALVVAVMARLERGREGKTMQVVCLKWPVASGGVWKEERRT